MTPRPVPVAPSFVPQALCPPNTLTLPPGWGAFA